MNISNSDVWSIKAHIHGKTFNVSCGDGSQSIKWLGHVAIARWDEESNLGWKRLGVPISIHHHSRDGIELDLSSSIRDVLQNGDEVFVSSSLQPHESK